ncbi:MAG: ribosome-associated translation inhibitor RaiA [Patescibacteria group bacterium]|jgi:putative sigma-54 modulation protein
MNIQITGKNIELTEAIKNYVNEKIGSLSKFHDKIMEARVEVEKCAPRNNKNNFRVLVNFSLPGDLLYVDQTEDNLYTAIDCAKEEMEAQLRKHKTKFESKKRQAKKTRRLFKSIFFWKNKEEEVNFDAGEREENE